MKTRTIIAMAAVLVAAAVFFWQGTLQADAMGSSSVAVVDVTRVLETARSISLER